MINKRRDDLLAVVEQIPNGASIAIGGFGLAGVPITLCDALCELDRRELHIVANNAGIDPSGVGRLAWEGRIRKFTGSFPSNPDFYKLFLQGQVEVELVPQGTLVERLRAAGAGIPAFFTPTSAGTPLADGTYPMRMNPDGSIGAYIPKKESRLFEGREFVLEHALHVDFALIRAHRVDRWGNVQFRRLARNFSPAFASAAQIAIVEGEHIVDVGQIDPDLVHLPGVYISHVVQAGSGKVDGSHRAMAQT